MHPLLLVFSTMLSPHAMSKDLQPRQPWPDLMYEVFGVPGDLAAKDPVLSAIRPMGQADGAVLARAPDFSPLVVNDHGRVEMWVFEFRPGAYTRFGGTFEPLCFEGFRNYRAGYIVWRRNGGPLHFHEWNDLKCSGDGPSAVNTARIDVRRRFLSRT